MNRKVILRPVLGGSWERDDVRFCRQPTQLECVGLPRGRLINTFARPPAKRGHATATFWVGASRLTHECQPSSPPRRTEFHSASARTDEASSSRTGKNSGDLPRAPLSPNSGCCYGWFH